MSGSRRAASSLQPVDGESSEGAEPRALTGSGLGLGAQLAPVLAYLALGALLFPSAGRDDKFLTFWPAHTLVEYGAILSYDLERVEQSSSLAFVLMTALLRACTGLAVPVVGWLLGIVAGALAIVAAGRLSERLRAGSGLLAMWLTATAGCWVYWSFGGAEPPWVALFALLFVAALGRVANEGPRPSSLALLGLVTSLWLTIRPEAFLVALCTTAGLAALGLARHLRARGERDAAGAPRGWRSMLTLVLVLSAALLVARQLAFDSALPQPVVAKSAGIGRSALLHGLRYVLREIWLWPLLALALAGAVRTLLRAWKGREADWTAVSLVLFVSAYLTFIALSGGDWMEAARFLAHIVPLLAVLAALGWPGSGAACSGRAARLATCGLVALGAWGAVALSRGPSRGLPLWVALEDLTEIDEASAQRFSWPERANLSHRRDMPVAVALDLVVARLLESRAPSEALLLLAQNTGFVVYHTQLRHAPRLRVYDHHGLSDRTMTHGAFADRLHRAQFGLMWKPEDYCAALEELGLRPPDICLFNAHEDARRAVFEPFGMSVVFVRQSPEELASAWAVNRQPVSDQVIAVRRELLPALRGLELPANSISIDAER